jgi:ankyrin repeat protein
MLLKAGAHVNASPAYIEGRTALEGAAEHGRLDLVQLLINAGAGANAWEDVRYERAAELAKENHHFAIAEILASYQDR